MLTPGIIPDSIGDDQITLAFADSSCTFELPQIILHLCQQANLTSLSSTALPSGGLQHVVPDLSFRMLTPGIIPDSIGDDQVTLAFVSYSGSLELHHAILRLCRKGE